jgi:hypothetical protein
MDIQTVSAWGELLGGIGGLVAGLGVIITLIYLARQIQQNTRSMQSTAYAACMQANAAVHTSHMAAADVLPDYLHNRGESWGLDTSVDYMKFHGHATQVFSHWELVFLLHQHGTVDDDYFASKMDLMRFAVTTLPGLRRWWSDNAEHFFDHRYRAVVDSVIDTIDPAVAST